MVGVSEGSGEGEGVNVTVGVGVFVANNPDIGLFAPATSITMMRMPNNARNPARAPRKKGIICRRFSNLLITLLGEFLLFIIFPI
jgi:hypothetical protein